VSAGHWLVPLVALAIACRNTSGRAHVRPEAAADVFADCMEDPDYLRRPADEPVAVGMQMQRDSCTARSGWVVDNDAYNACIMAQAQSNNAFGPGKAPMPILYRQMRTCSTRAGHVK
jgi:hypothetical protein